MNPSEPQVIQNPQVIRPSRTRRSRSPVQSSGSTPFHPVCECEHVRQPRAVLTAPNTAAEEGGPAAGHLLCGTLWPIHSGGPLDVRGAWRVQWDSGNFHGKAEPATATSKAQVPEGLKFDAGARQSKRLYAGCSARRYPRREPHLPSYDILPAQPLAPRCFAWRTRCQSHLSCVAGRALPLDPFRFVEPHAKPSDSRTAVIPRRVPASRHTIPPQDAISNWIAHTISN